MNSSTSPNLISILIPAYNSEKWIGQTIKSAIEQTWPRKEVIIVDDGSTDNTLAIAKTFESKCVKVVVQDNAGACAARNKALSFAQGDYIQWLDADDILAPNKIEKQMFESELIANPRILLTSSWANFYYRYKNANFTPDNLWHDLSPIEWIMTTFREPVWMNPATWLVTRKLTELAGPWDQRLTRDDDGEYICRVVGQSDMVKFVSEAKSYYRQSNPNSLSKDLSDKSCESIFLSRSLCIEHLRSLEDTKETRAACLMYLQKCLPYFNIHQTEILKKANVLAKDLGGELVLPTPTWKYAMLERVLGPLKAKDAKRVMTTLKVQFHRNWDKLLRDLFSGSGQ